MIAFFMLSIPFAAAEEPEKLHDYEVPSQNSQEGRKRRTSKKSKERSKKRPRIRNPRGILLLELDLE